LGKVKGRIKVPSGLSKDEQQSLVEKNSEVQDKLDGMQVIKVISVPGKLVNFVVKK
jgi:leucyl-tRNA synthetase